jgi:hypothetical protein
MSYGSRSMKESDDLLFRVKTTIPGHRRPVHVYDHDAQGNLIKGEDGYYKRLPDELKWFDEYSSYDGPYVSLPNARSMRTKAKKAMERNKFYKENDIDWSVTIEACMPEWKEVE